MPLPLLCIAGATGSGKSDLCISLAKVISGEVLCIDAVQVYRGADIGSAKVTSEECDGVPHHCLDLIEPDEFMDAVKFGSLCRGLIDKIRERGNTPILCVGSTMYFQAVIYDLIEATPRDEQFRTELESVDTQSLHERLQGSDPTRALKLHPNDRIRIIRALEVLKHSPETMTSLHANHAFSNRLYRSITYCLVRSRRELYERIEARTDKMIKNGLVEETRLLLKKYGSSAPLFRAIGYSQAKEMTVSEDTEPLRASVAQATRNYAKRQLTFWKNEPQKRGMAIFPEQAVRGRGISDPIVLELTSREILNRYETELHKDPTEASVLTFIGPTD